MNKIKNQLGAFDNDPEFQISSSEYEYSILISPSDHIKNEVVRLKLKINSMFSLSEYELNSIPHITLIKFPRGGDNDKAVIEAATRVLLAEKTFDLKIQNADFFKNPDVDHIILKVEKSQSIQQIYARLRLEFKPPRRFGKNFTPHLTIAKGISHENLEKVLPFLHEFNLETNFICDRITILRKVIQDTPTKYTRIAEVLLK